MWEDADHEKLICINSEFLPPYGGIFLSFLMPLSSDNTNLTRKTIPEEVGEVSPLAGYLLRHFFQTVAIAIPSIGFLGYAIGRSFYDGWDEAAGIPTTLFPVDAYALILQGLKLPEPWYWALACAGLLFFLIKLIEIFDICMSQWAVRRRKKALLRAKREWPRAKHYLAWKERKRKINGSAKIYLAPNGKKFFLTVLTTFMVLAAMVGSVPLYQLLKISFLDRSHTNGVQQYVGIHMAVTGRLPIRYGKISEDKLLEYACKARNDMWKYRAVAFNEPFAKKDKDSEPIVGYMLRNAGDVFLFLTAEGTIIKSYGESGFEMRESTSRPISSLMDTCPKS